MNNRSTILFFVSTIMLFLLLIGCENPNGYDKGNVVKDITSFNQAVKNLQPGDKIVLANGIWNNTELLFSGKGTPENPITLTVQEKGKVFLEGQSNIRIAGEHLIVEGLVFRNGYTPTSEVISFKKSKNELCNNCRVTECVVDNFNNPERFESDYWVGIYGKNNRFDHNYLTGKRNQGVTLAVRLNTKESHANNNRVDHNYFGHRPALGSNGGETLRVGTSHYSLTNSNTIVENNYFDRCSGELEIISSKSCQNIYRNNTFFECKGTLTMRHGNETLVENNVFFGNKKSNTGGIRVINETQTVRNNYCEGLTGYRFRGAMVIMNGVPNSPMNRYFQVTDSEVSNNTFLNCDHIQLCAGSDAERSATPINTKVANNIFYTEDKPNLFTVYDDISGIDFKKNLISPKTKNIQDQGFANTALTFEKNKDGISIPTTNKETGYQPKGEIATAENTGVSWYEKKEETIRFNIGKVIKVKAGENTILDAIATSNYGDIIELQEAGDYLMTKVIELKHPITIKTAQTVKEKPVLKFEKTSLFNIENGGSLALDGLQFLGDECRDKGGNAVIRTSKYSMNINYKLLIDNCDFKNLDINHSFNVLTVFQNTFADSIALTNCNFENITGHVLALAKEKDDIGIYNAEHVIIDNCNFKNIGGSVLDLYRGGRDESTFGPILAINNCQFDKVGKDKRNKTGSSIRLHGVQWANIANCTFKDTEPVNLHLVVGDPIIKLADCAFTNSGKIITNDNAIITSNISYK